MAADNRDAKHEARLAVTQLNLEVRNTETHEPSTPKRRNANADVNAHKPHKTQTQAKRKPHKAQIIQKEKKTENSF